MSTSNTDEHKKEEKLHPLQGGPTTTFRLPLPEDGEVISITVETKRENNELVVSLTMV